MKFQIKLNLMKDYLNKISTSVHSIASRVELTGILISVFDNSIIFEGRNDNLDIKIEETSLTEVKIIETGRVLIKANMLNEVIKRMEGDIVTFTKIDSNLITIESSGLKYDMNLLIDENFETANYMEDASELLQISHNDFHNSLTKVIFAGKESHTKFIYQGVNFSVDKNILTTTVCDGVRIASHKTEIKHEGILNKIIPIVVIKELLKLLPTKGNYDFQFKENKGVVKSENITIQFSLIEGTFPIFNKFFDKELYNSKLEINKSLLFKSIDQVTVLSMNKLDSSRVSIFINENELKLESNEIEIGSADVVLNNFSYNGGSIKVSFSPKILFDVLRISSSENISIYFKDNKSTILLLSESDGLIYLMSPMV